MRSRLRWRWPVSVSSPSSPWIIGSRRSGVAHQELLLACGGAPVAERAGAAGPRAENIGVAVRPEALAPAEVARAKVHARVRPRLQLNNKHRGGGGQEVTGEQSRQAAPLQVDQNQDGEKTASAQDRNEVRRSVEGRGRGLARRSCRRADGLHVTFPASSPTCSASNGAAPMQMWLR